MIDIPQLITTKSSPVAFIHLQLSMEEMMLQFGPAVGELIAAVAAQGQSPAGPVFAHHLHMDPDCTGVPERFDFELGVPLAAPVTASGRMKPGTMPSVRAAATNYYGPYEGLPGAWGEFMGWIKTQGLKPGSDLYETYITGPQDGGEPATWQTGFIRPLLD